MQRISADLIHNSRAFYNPLKERQLDMRGYKLIVIENLGAMEDQFDTLDLSDNEIKKVDNFPRMLRLRTILLTNNHVTRLDGRVGRNLSNLEHLILTNNRITDLSELDALAQFPSLSSVSLVDNPVTRRPNYRAYVIQNVPQLKVLDFRKIKPKEREAARQLFESDEGQKLITAVQAAQEEKQKVGSLGCLLRAPSKPFSRRRAHVCTACDLQVAAAGPTDEEKQALRAAINNATTAEQLDQLERMSRAGVYDLKVLRAMAGKQ